MATSRQIVTLIQKAQDLTGPITVFGQSGVRIRGDLTESMRFIAAGTKALEKNVNAAHATAIREFYSLGNRRIETDRRRPQERGNRPDDRQTGTMRFGKSQAFNGNYKTFDDAGVAVLTFVDIDRADNITNYVWRSVEFGLSGTKHQTSSPLGPRGRHRLPHKFYFGKKGEVVDVYTPGLLSKKRERSSRNQDEASRLSQGAFQPRGRANRAGAGFEGQHWVERTANEVIEKLGRNYARIIIDSYV